MIPIRLPPLRERPRGHPAARRALPARAAARLGKALAGFATTRRRGCSSTTWPGNVRELENVVERAAVLAAGPAIALADLGTKFAAPRVGSALRPTLDELERDYIRRVLDEVGGDKVAAARVLGVSVRTLQRRAKEQERG